MGTVFFSVSKALISFQARHVPSSAVGTITTLHDHNVGICVTAKHPLTFVSGLKGLRFSKVVAIANTRYFAERNRVVCRRPISARDMRHIVTRRRGKVSTCPAVFIYGSRLFVSRIASRIYRIVHLLSVRIPPIFPTAYTQKGSILRLVSFFGTSHRRSCVRGLVPSYISVQ